MRSLAHRLGRVMAALLAAASLQCLAAPFAVQLGDARIGLDTPPGFADTGFTGSPRLQELAESLTSASNRILMFAITDADLRAFMVGDRPEFRRYMVVVTPRALERDRVSPETFARVVADALLGLGPPENPADVRAHLEALQAGRTAHVEELRREPETVSVLQGTRLPPSDLRRHSEFALSTTTLMLLRGKALNLAVYTYYDSPADLEWIRAVTARWTEELRRLNP